MTTTEAPAAVTELPQWLFFDTVVARVRPLGPSTVRITLTGPQLGGFGVAGDDQRVKLVLAPDPAALAELQAAGGEWYPVHCALADDRRPVLRTYTVRAARPERAEVDLDVVLHGVGDGHAGPAATWAAAARPGDAAVLMGPDRPGRGRAWGVEWAPPATATRLLLVGDETAVPAVSAVLESLPEVPGRRAVAVLEVPGPGDAQNLALPEGVTVHWLFRQGRPRGELTVPAVHAALVDLGVAAAPAAAPEDVDLDAGLLWEVPEDPAAGAGCYAWLAGEAGVVKRLRRHLVGDLGVDRRAVAFMGYWREGRAEG
ncbi:NADPH-dependent ferric siderophore reductase, contains FAD-binding and SIP domains [Geodermatophilus dictyosporus]|uniref:NADPH-dependent ferric siderophore reductase, contains FAD-binding and SIP domains n=1 Tax=Geodermatophilus dictyosporus TaxID=1523247 RepID=A0A1I5UQW3_9ACTN|nr:siderophore-interacting protein [Geodermatophilus dictyosporus]SFP97076.1 NADPH-dependent ferric siderophore reductase, contains FAD-binding and SIP domains [Geodermatophilus dictyosporus]